LADVPSSQGVSTPSSGPRDRIAVVAIGGVGFAAGALVGAYLNWFWWEIGYRPLAIVLAAAILVALPAALVGGAVTVLIDGDLTIGSIAGFLGLFGLVARHAVLFVRRGQHLEDRQGEDFGPELVARAARGRFAPVVVSSVATAVVFLPLLFLSGRAGLEIVGPMAAVVLGGIVTVTAVSLFLVPALYLRFGERSEAEREQFDLVQDLIAERNGANGDGAGAPLAPSRPKEALDVPT